MVQALHVARIAMLVQFCAVAYGQASAMRINTSLVLIPVHVTSPEGVTVTGLHKDDFNLFEDGVRQTITHFVQDDAPISAGVLLDISGSMKNKMAKTCAAATAFFQSANPEDEFFLVEFNARAKVKIPFTHDWSEIAGEIGRAKTSGLTALLDAIHLAAGEMKKARNTRKALIVISDGGDNFSRRNLRQLRATLIESDVQVYILGVFDPDLEVKHTREERRGPSLLGEVALDTGGRDFPIVNLNQLADIGEQLTRDLRNQYVLGYSPLSLTTDGKYHQVKLTLQSGSTAGLRTYYRRGYYAPTQ